MYTMAPRPEISGAELAQLEEAQLRPGGICNRTRPETLGYQQCWRLAEHAGAHLSQDGQAWVEDHAERPGTGCDAGCL